MAYVDYGSDTVYLCTSTGSELQRARLKQPYGTIESLAFSPDGSLLSAGTQRGGVAVWDVLPGLHVEGGEYNERYAAIVHNACVPAVCLPDNGHLLSVSESGAVLETRLEEQSFGFLEHDAIVSCTLRLPDRELMLVGEADGISHIISQVAISVGQPQSECIRAVGKRLGQRKLQCECLLFASCPAPWVDGQCRCGEFGGLVVSQYDFDFALIEQFAESHVFQVNLQVEHAADACCVWQSD